MSQTCPQHGLPEEHRCSNCAAPICPRCAYLRLSSVPWCRPCGEAYIQANTPRPKRSLVIAAKVVIVLGGICLPIVLLPILQYFAAVAVGLLLARLLFLGDSPLPPINVLEVGPRQGPEVGQPAAETLRSEP